MKFAGLTLSALLFAGTIFAQRGPSARFPGAGGGAFQALKTYLNLSDAQVSNLTAVERAMRDALKPLAQELASKTKTLRDENQKTTPDPSVIAQLKQDIAGLRDQIQTQRAGFQKQLKSYLNPDQLASLAKLDEVLRLVPVAHAAAALDLIDSPEGFAGGRMGMAGPGRPGMMMRKRPLN
jgi:Spy/CpxP family protein refolding chaperone